jgi:hypothetical protein
MTSKHGGSDLKISDCTSTSTQYVGGHIAKAQFGGPTKWQQTQQPEFRNSPRTHLPFASLPWNIYFSGFKLLMYLTFYVILTNHLI